MRATVRRPRAPTSRRRRWRSPSPPGRARSPSPGRCAGRFSTPPGRGRSPRPRRARPRSGRRSSVAAPGRCAGARSARARSTWSGRRARRRSRSGPESCCPRTRSPTSTQRAPAPPPGRWASRRRRRWRPPPSRFDAGDRLAVGVERPDAALVGADRRGRAADLERLARPRRSRRERIERSFGRRARSRLVVAADQRRKHDRGDDRHRDGARGQPTAARRRRGAGRGAAAARPRSRRRPGEPRAPGPGRGSAACSRCSGVAGLDPELLGEDPAPLVVDGERVGLTAGPVEREHELAAQPLAQRMRADERVELGDQLGVPPERELGLDPRLDRLQAQLLEAADRPRRTARTRARRAAAAPEAERGAQPSRCRRRIAALEQSRGPRAARPRNGSGRAAPAAIASAYPSGLRDSSFGAAVVGLEQLAKS